MPLNIFYIDDEKELLEVFSEMFSTNDVNIKTFTDPENALVEILKNPPDLIFLDYRLTNTTGDEVAKKINSNIPKVLLSGDLTVQLQSHFDACFDKPYNIEAIQAYIDSRRIK